MDRDIGDELFGSIDRFVTIKILGEEIKVPEGEDLLRCFQYIAPETIPYGDFCWNGDCGNCEATLERDGLADSYLCCQTIVADGDSILLLSGELSRQLEGIL